MRSCAITSNLVHKLHSQELIINIEDNRGSDLVEFLCEIISIELIQDLIRPPDIVLVDRIDGEPPVVVSALRKVPGLTEGVEFFVQEVLHVHLDASVHAGFLQVSTEEKLREERLTHRSRKLRSRQHLKLLSDS